MPNVIKVQEGYKVQPLSAYLKQPAPPAAAPIDWPKIDKEMVKTNFFEYLDFVMPFAPPGPEEEAIRAKLATIGVGPGKKFDFKDLSVEHKAAILLAMKEGDTKVDKFSPTASSMSTDGASAPGSATGRSTTVTGCYEQPLPRGAFTATTQRRRCTP